jgi:predicted porin
MNNIGGAAQLDPNASASCGSSAVNQGCFNNAFDVAGAYSYTHASESNGIDDSARYRQISLKEDYRLSKRTTLYALQAWQHAGGRTLGAAGAGDIIDAAPVVGDSQNATPSTTSSQFVAMFGLAVTF